VTVPGAAGDNLKPAVIPVRPVVERAIAQVAHLPVDYLTTDLDDVVAFVDAHAVSRVTTNLVINAIRHTPPSTPMDVTLRADQTSVTLRVADAGPGIPPELRSLVMEPYVTSTADGSGLGLAVSRALVEGMGGQLRILDNRPNGTVVTATFPLAPDDATSNGSAGVRS